MDLKKSNEEQVKFAGFVNRLYEAILSRKRQEVIAVILEGLSVYTYQQFRFEEELMSACGHEDYQAHKIQHARLLNKINDFKIKYKEGNDSLGFELAEFLNKKLIAHISLTDKKMRQNLEVKTE